MKYIIEKPIFLKIGCSLLEIDKANIALCNEFYAWRMEI